MTPLASLLGARVRRIDGPEPGLLALTLFTPELRSVLLFRSSGEPSGVGLVAERPHGLAASSFVQKLRKELENARITAFEQPAPRTLALLLRRGELSTRLICDFAQAACWIERDGKVLIRTPASSSVGHTPKASQIGWPETVEALQISGEGLVSQAAVSSLDLRRREFSRLLRAAQKRLQRRLQALDGDIARADEAPPLRARANSLLTQQHLVKRGQTSVQLTDYTLDPPAAVEIELDPKRTLQEQIEAWFKQAKRFERGAQLASQRRELTEREIAQLEELVQLAAAAADGDELMELGERARALGLGGVGRAVSTETGRKPPTRQEHKPYRQFAGWKERVILVGKNAESNDVLTREHARPQDLWLHARGHAGAHVVVPLQRNETCPEELLLDAAHLAAHFSGARGEPSVEISYTGKRYVRKARGAAPGQATLEREKVLLLHVEPTRLERLLARERRD